MMIGNVWHGDDGSAIILHPESMQTVIATLTASRLTFVVFELEP